MEPDVNPFMARWGQATDSEWLTALLRACHDPKVEGIDFPTLPASEIQRTIQGNSEEIAVRGSFAFYRFVRDSLQANGIKLEPATRMLDFGTGWGRMIRPFMRELPARNIYGVEPSAEWARIARGCNPYVAILQSEFTPPLQFRPDFFRYIIAYSIFTHLPEALFDAWLEEFARILEPGGVVALTFLGQRMMDELSKYPRPLPPGADIHFWHRILVEAIETHDPGGHRYAADEFVFLPTGETPQYGDTFISPALIRRKLEKNWNILVIDSTALAQDICVIQKR